MFCFYSDFEIYQFYQKFTKTSTKFIKAIPNFVQTVKPSSFTQKWLITGETR